MYLVTGGAGFFGETLLKRLLKTGNKVKCLDLNIPHFNHENLITLQGDVRDKNLVIEALKDVEIVHHNVAQVPLAKNKKLFWEVNLGATKLILEEAFERKIKNLYILHQVLFLVFLSKILLLKTISHSQWKNMEKQNMKQKRFVINILS